MQEKRLVEPESETSGSTTTTTEETSSNGSGFTLYPDKTFNRRIALGSALGALGLFLSKRLDFGVSLKDLSAAALPYEEVFIYLYFNKTMGLKGVFFWYLNC